MPSTSLDTRPPGTTAPAEHGEDAHFWQRRALEQAALLEQARDAIVLHALDGRIRFWNGGAERMYGFDRATAVGRTFAELLGPAAAIPADAHQQLLAHGEWRGVLECTDARGQVLTVERRCSRMTVGDEQAPMVAAVDTDVTERRRAEKEIVLLSKLLEQRIRSRTAQLEASNEDLRGLAYSLAHDLRAPLASLDVFSRELQQRARGLDERAQHYLRRIRAGVQLMSQLTGGLLALADLSNAALLHHSVDMSSLASAAIDRLREREPHRAVAVAVLPTRRAQGDVRLLTDLMENLLGNAWKFTSGRRDAHIEFGGEWTGDGQYRYWVRDNGAGFDPEYGYKLFKPFQRLHAAGEFPGTGIGLAIVRKIVTRHGGRVWAESSPGRGAEFSFTLGDTGAAGPIDPAAP